MKRPKIGFEPVIGPRSPRARYIWDGEPARPPKKGEFYLSGAIPQAWKAPNDLSTDFYIMKEIWP